MSTETNGRNSIQILTEKQIIKELKCLIAKQEQQINHLIQEVQKLKSQKALNNDLNANVSIAFSNLESSRALQNGLNSKQSLNKNLSNHASVTHSKSSANREFKHSQISQIESSLKSFQKCVKQFTVKVLEPFNEKHGFTSKNFNSKEKEENLKLQSNLRQTNFQSLTAFAIFFPHLLKQVKAFLKHLDIKIAQKSEQEESLRKKVKEQEKTLRQMMNQYEKNIIQSEKMQAKLMEEVKRLKNSSKQGFTEHSIFQKHIY